MEKITPKEFTRIANDTFGNPRYVCHYLWFLTSIENGFVDESTGQYVEGTVKYPNAYPTAIKRANKLGGRKFHNKQYGGGVVFQSYNIENLCKHINEFMQSENTKF